jgi:hypothetical protein
MISKTGFTERCAFWAANGGEWQARNEDYKPGDQAPESFEYHVAQEPFESSIGFTIYAMIADQKLVIWKGYHYWHDLKNKSIYLSLGSEGQICNGETHHDLDLYFEILNRNGSVIYILNHDEIINENEVKATAQTFSEGQWKQLSSLHWKRM